MKRIFVSLAIIMFVAVAAISATRASFTATETSTGNTFSAGALDLQVDGQDSVVAFSVANMVPGDKKGSPTYQLCNVGSVPGRVTMSVNNLTTDENNVIDPESAAGDADSVRIDPDGYTVASGGFGELLDQVVMRFWVDDTAGQRPAAFDWQDTYWEGYPDESAVYHLTVGSPIPMNHDFVLQPNTCGYAGVVTTFIDDTNTPYQWIVDGVSNNAAMGDDISFDLTFGLTQVTP